MPLLESPANARLERCWVLGRVLIKATGSAMREMSGSE